MPKFKKDIPAAIESLERQIIKQHDAYRKTCTTLEQFLSITLDIECCRVKTNVSDQNGDLYVCVTTDDGKKKYLEVWQVVDLIKSADFSLAVFLEHAKDALSNKPDW